MGTRGRGAVTALLLASVAEQVVHTANCPVMTVDNPHAAVEEARCPVRDACAARFAGD